MSMCRDGAELLIDDAHDELARALKTARADAALAFPGTTHHLPLACSLTGYSGGMLRSAEGILENARAMVRDGAPGFAALLASELVCFLRSFEPAPAPWIGFVPDTILRVLGVQFADGRISGMCVTLGTPHDPETSVYLVRQAQQRNLLTLLCGSSPRGTLPEDLSDQGAKVGLETFVVPLGPETAAASYAAGIMTRLALIYGRVPPGNSEEISRYCSERVKTICLVLSAPDARAMAVLSGLRALGVELGALQPYEGLAELPVVSTAGPGTLVRDTAEARGIRVAVVELDVPVPYGPAFEGERVRREEMRVEFGGKASTAFELLLNEPVEEVVDGDVTVVGPDLDDVSRGNALPLGLVVRVGGRGMQQVFEPVLERHIHAFLNQASGLFHVGQRNLCWLRISETAYDAGLRLRHVGTILHGMVHRTFGRFVDRVAVQILTNQSDVERMLPTALAAYSRRDRRMAGLTDEAVDVFYSCALCQSFAPNHLCIVKPERMGLCGAYTWLDARACYEMDPTGPNQPVAKGAALDVERGEWRGVNDFILKATNGIHARFCAYSAMSFPETSCGCFECIIAIVPEANGFLVVNREYDGETPIGMAFGTLAGAVGGGQQNPGFMGVARNYIVSPKFIRADGGLARIVWMPQELKEALRQELSKRARMAGHADLLDRIADETHATDLQALVEFLERAAHPALSMPPLL
jgi:CO dehydrogenase/CO-methylating acetyl-CoA synthase complex beta subunit